MTWGRFQSDGLDARPPRAGFVDPWGGRGAVGWQVYEITKRPLDLGLVGLAQFLPGIFLFLVSGHVADRFDRRKLLMLCYGGFAACSGLLWEIALRGAHSVYAGVYPRVYPIYAVLVLLGVVRSFSGPVSRALLPQL